MAVSSGAPSKGITGVTSTPTESWSSTGWRRHPADLTRFVLALAVAGLVVIVGALLPEGVRNTGADLIALLDNIPVGISSFLVGFTQLVALLVPLGVAVVLVARRSWKLLGLLALAAVLAAVTMALANHFLDDVVPVTSTGRERPDAWFVGVRFPSATYLASLVAVVVAASRWLTRPWRRAAWVLVGLVVLTRVITATEVPIRVALLLALGAAAGSLALVIMGAPPRRVDEETVVDALAQGGLALSDLRPTGEGAGVPTYQGRLGGGALALVKVMGRDERDGAILLRAWRALRVKGLGDDRPVTSPWRTVEREALALGLAGGAGARVPVPLAVAETDEGAVVLATTWLDGPVLAEVLPEQITHERLADLWRQVARLHERRVAHRSLRADNVLVTVGGPALVDFRSAALNATDRLLGADVAELLTSTAVLVGVDRAVDAATEGIGPTALGAALPLVQPAVLTPPTRAGAKADKELLPSLRTSVQEAAGVDKIELAEVKRITFKNAVMAFGSLVLALYLFALVANFQEIWDELKSADWAYLPWMLLATFGTYVAGAVSMIGSVTNDLPLWRSTEVMFAQAFLNRFTPANAGGMALRARYLQVQGIDLTVAAAAVGLTSVASGAVQVVFIVVFFVWGGTTDAFSQFTWPDTGTILVVAIALGAVGGAILLSRWGRRTVLPLVRRTVGKALGSFGELLHRPDKLALLFGGAALSKLLTIITFYLSIKAFGVEMPFAQAGALYMVANTVGSAVPTPGGVGGIEAALTAVLLSVGLDEPVAAAIVLLFRLISYWLPTLPGWFFLKRVEKKGYV